MGRPHCPELRSARSARQTPQQIVDRILDLPEGTRFQVLAPVVRGRKGEYEAFLDDLAKQGFARARVDGEVIELSDRAALEPGALRAAHHRGRRRPPGPTRRHPPAPHRVDGDGAAPRRRRSPRSASSARTARRSSSPSPSTWRAPTAGCRSRSRRRATSRSTRLTGHVRRATASGPSSRSTPSWSCRTRTRRIAEGAIVAVVGGRSGM